MPNIIIEKLLIDDIIAYLLKMICTNRSRSINFIVDIFAVEHREKGYVVKGKQKPAIKCSIRITSALCIALANILIRKELNVNQSGSLMLEEIIVSFENGRDYPIPIEIIKSFYLPVIHD